MKDFPVIGQRVALDFLGESFICFLRACGKVNAVTGIILGRIPYYWNIKTIEV